MHICFLNMPIEYYSPVSGGAIATIIMQTGRELMARGHDVTVLTATNGDEQYDVGTVVSIDMPKRDDLSFIARRVSSVRRRLNQWDWPYYEYYLKSFRGALRHMRAAPDAVVVFNDLVSQKYLRRIVPESQVLVWLQNEWRTNQRDSCETVAATDRFLTCSDYIRDWTSQMHGIPLEKFAVVPSGVDLEAFAPRVEYLKAGDELRVLFIGRIDPNKGPDIAADAVAALRGEGLSVSLTVAGGLWFYGHGQEMADPYFRSLKGKMDAAGARYRGHVTRSHVPELVREHDVVCVLSRSNEPFGLVVLETMASGCAVIASDRGGLPEACGGAAMLVDPDDFGSVVSALRTLATEPETLREYKRRSVERARVASWAVCAERLESLLMGEPIAV
jgi:glycosyltransferase involved in cell wall biosynthesis